MTEAADGSMKKPPRSALSGRALCRCRSRRRGAEVDGLGEGGSGDGSTAEELLPPLGAPLSELGNPRNAGRVGPGVESGTGSGAGCHIRSRSVCRSPVQPGTVTELYPDKDGSPSSAPALTSKFGLCSRLAVATWPGTVGLPMEKLCSNSRRTHASNVHNVGSWGGASGPLAACGLRPITDSRPETRVVMMSAGEAGALTTAGAAGVTKAAVLAWKPAAETAGAAAAITVGDALVVRELVAAASLGRAVTGGAASATFADTSAVPTLVAGELAAKDLPRVEDVEVLASVLLVAGVVFVGPC